MHARQPTSRVLSAGAMAVVMIVAILTVGASGAGAEDDPTTYPNYQHPTVTGTLVPGSSLTVDVGYWPGWEDFLVQWTQNGQDVPGAVGPTLTLDAGDVGTFIAVDVTAIAGENRKTVHVPVGPLTIPSVSGIKMTTTAVSGRMTWRPSPGATGYLLTVPPRKVRGVTEIVLGTKTFTRFLQGFDPSHTYTWNIQALYGSVRSAPASFSFRTRRFPKATKLHRVHGAKGSTGVAWPAVEGADHYVIVYWRTDKGPKRPRSLQLISRGTTLRGLKPGATYTARVVSYSPGYDVKPARSVSKPYSFTAYKKK